MKQTNQFTDIFRQQPQIRAKEFVPFSSARFEQENKDQVDDIQRSIIKDKKKKKKQTKKNKKRIDVGVVQPIPTSDVS